jgi:threonine dehydrogenase-like Zn-dependent dehydrogenase
VLQILFTKEYRPLRTKPKMIYRGKAAVWRAAKSAVQNITPTVAAASASMTSVSPLSLSIEDKDFSADHYGDSTRPITTVVRVMTSSVNMSDVKMSQGLMAAYTPASLISGRDYSGVVVQGSPHWEGKSVFGTGGTLGMQRDGSHAQYLMLDSDQWLTEKPDNLTHDEAGTLGVPYLTAYDCLVSKAKVKPNEIVAISGALFPFVIASC